MKLLQYIIYLIINFLQNIIDILDYWEVKLDCKRNNLPSYIDLIKFVKPLSYKDYFGN